MAFTGVEGTIGSNAPDLLIGGDLVEQFGQHRRIAHVAGGELGRTDLQCLLVNSDVDLAPYTAFRAAMFARSSGKQSPGLFSDPPGHCSRAGGRVYRSAQPPRSWRDRTRSSASRGA